MLVSSTRRVGRPMYFEAACVAAVDPRDDAAAICTGVRPLTQWYNDQMAKAIGPAVEQYWWVHRRWRPKPARAAAQSLQDAAAKAA